MRSCVRAATWTVSPRTLGNTAPPALERSPLRILFTFAGGTGHLLPLLPFARAARERGHAVAFGCQAVLLPTVEQAGFAAFDTAGTSFRDESERAPLLRPDPAREDRAVREGFARRIARERAAAILDRAGNWRPDLLVCDEMDFGAMVAAERLGLPHAQVLVIASGALARRELIAEPLQALRAEHGLPADPGLAMLSRHLVLSPFPPGFRDPAFPLPATAHAFRPGSVPAPDAGPPIRPAGRPTAYVTLGTVFNVESGDLFRRVLAGIGSLPLDVIATVGPQIDPAELGPQPGHIRIERYVDQWTVLPHCDLVVSHAGSGTVMGALTHGLPMVLLPMGADQPLNARRCPELGVARVLDPVEATPRMIREAGAAVLADPAYRSAAQSWREAIAALPEPALAVPLMERLTAAGKNAAPRVQA